MGRQFDQPIRAQSLPGTARQYRGRDGTLAGGFGLGRAGKRAASGLPPRAYLARSCASAQSATGSDLSPALRRERTLSGRHNFNAVRTKLAFVSALVVNVVVVHNAERSRLEVSVAVLVPGAPRPRGRPFATLQVTSLRPRKELVNHETELGAPRGVEPRAPTVREAPPRTKGRRKHLSRTRSRTDSQPIKATTPIPLLPAPLVHNLWSISLLLSCPERPHPICTRPVDPIANASTSRHGHTCPHRKNSSSE